MIFGGADGKGQRTVFNKHSGLKFASLCLTYLPFSIYVKRIQQIERIPLSKIIALALCIGRFVRMHLCDLVALSKAVTMYTTIQYTL